MPVSSKAQWRLMEGIKHRDIKSKGSLTPEKAAEFVNGGHAEYAKLPEEHKERFKKLKKMCSGGKV
jgi:hypothetical protein